MNAITISEISRLSVLENEIEKGIFATGRALRLIRDEKLYRRDFDTFEAYCEGRWKFSKVHAYRQIEAAAVIESLPEKVTNLVTNEGQARALGDVPEPEREAVLQAAAAAGPVTAAAIEEAADAWQPKLNESAMLERIGRLWGRFGSLQGEPEKMLLNGVNVLREAGLHLQGLSGHKRMSQGKFIKLKDALPAGFDWPKVQECVRLAVKFPERVKDLREAANESDTILKVRGTLAAPHRQEEQFATDITPPVAFYHASTSLQARLRKVIEGAGKWDDDTRQSVLEELERLAEWVAVTTKKLIAEGE